MTNKAQAFKALDTFAASRVKLIESMQKAGYATLEECRPVVIEWACAKTGRELRVADPGCIVWDEVVAFALVLFLNPFAILMSFVALAIDRRALLVSSLAYVLYALSALFSASGAVELSAALTAFVIGSALLTLSAFWHQMRGLVLGMVGGLRDKLPPVQTVVPA